MTATSKRGFLKIVGGALLGGKKVAETAVAEAAQMAGLSAGSGDGHSFIGMSGRPVSRSQEDVAKQEAIWRRMMMSNDLPSWKVKELKREVSRVYSLDPDIASFRSFSLAAKIHMQRQRQYDRALEYAREGFDLDDARRAFLEKHGFNWFY